MQPSSPQRDARPNTPAMSSVYIKTQYTTSRCTQVTNICIVACTCTYRISHTKRRNMPRHATNMPQHKHNTTQTRHDTTQTQHKHSTNTTQHNTHRSSRAGAEALASSLHSNITALRQAVASHLAAFGSSPSQLREVELLGWPVVVEQQKWMVEVTVRVTLVSCGHLAGR